MPKFKIPSQSVQWAPCRFRQTARHEESNGHFPQFCELCRVQENVLRRTAACFERKGSRKGKIRCKFGASMVGSFVILHHLTVTSSRETSASRHVLYNIFALPPNTISHYWEPVRQSLSTVCCERHNGEFKEVGNPWLLYLAYKGPESMLLYKTTIRI